MTNAHSKIYLPLFAAAFAITSSVSHAEQREVDVTITNDHGTAEVHHDIDVKKTEAGKAWTRDTEGSSSRGGSWFSRTIGEAVKSSSGAGTWSSHTDGTRKKANGESVDYQVDRKGNWVSHGDGTIDRTSTVNRSNDRGYESTVDKVGTVTKTENGRSYEGTHTGSDNKGRTWTTNVQKESVRNGDGTASFNKTDTTTKDNGTTVTRKVTGTASKTESGRSIDKTATVTRTDAEGNVIEKRDREARKAELNSDEARAKRKAEWQARQADRKAELKKRQADRESRKHEAKQDRKTKDKRARDAARDVRDRSVKRKSRD